VTDKRSDGLDRGLHAIADPMRRKILQILKRGRHGERGICASDIESKVRLSQSTVSHHMAILLRAGLVTVQKEGLWRWYRRNEAALSDLLRKLRRGL